MDPGFRRDDGEGTIRMAYDLLIKNGRIVDGSGGPSYRGDVAVKDGKIVEIGKLSGPAARTIDTEGRVVAPGFIDNHCHYDAQITWDPLCTFSCDHGATSVVFGNCSLSLAPVRKGKEERLCEFLSYVEAIPMEVLNTLEFTWESFPEYLDQMDHHLGVNVGNLIGHTAVRYYVMGDECQKRTATDDEIREMQGLVRDGMQAGALGLSVSRNQGHFDPQGIRAFPMCTPNRITDYFQMRNTQTFRGLPVWHPICLSSPEEMLKAYADPEVRKKLHDEAVEFKNGPAIGICSTWWDYMVVQTAVLPKNKQFEGKTLGQIAQIQGKGVIDCFLDLAIEENLDTEWLHGENNVDDKAVAQILNYPNAIIGLSDGGAHVQFQSGFGFSTRLLSEWVREKKIMSLEQAVRRLTFESASIFGLYDRGLLRPGMVADIVIFDPDTVKPLPLEVLHDFPTGAKRIKEPAQGIHMTIVNGQVLLDEGKHTGALPGRVLRNTYYRAQHA